MKTTEYRVEVAFKPSAWVEVYNGSEAVLSSYDGHATQPRLSDLPAIIAALEQVASDPATDAATRSAVVPILRSVSGVRRRRVEFCSGPRVLYAYLVIDPAGRSGLKITDEDGLLVERDDTVLVDLLRHGLATYTERDFVRSMMTAAAVREATQ